MKRILLLIGVLAVLSPMAVLAGCGEKETKNDEQAVKNAAAGAAAVTKSGATQNPNKPKLAPPPP